MDLQLFEKTAPVYTRMILCFPQLPKQCQESVFDALGWGLEAVVREVPVIGGTVVGASDDPDRGHRHIRAGSFHGLQREYLPLYGYADLRRENFPMRILDDTFLPTSLAQPFPTPVFAAQVNFMKRGFLLGLSFHHSALDIIVSAALWSVKRSTA